MSNPFASIITSDMKTLFTNAIDSLLENSACMVECQLIYGDTKWTDCPNCFEKDTIIKCRDGFKKIQNVVIGDRVYNGVSYTKVNNTSISLYNGVLYNFKCSGISLPQHVTANHKFPIVRQLRKRYKSKDWYDKDFVLSDYQIEEVSAKDIQIGDALILPLESKLQTKDLKNIYIDGFGDVVVDEDLLFMIGWWLAEGCLHKSQYIRSGSFCLCASKEENIADKLCDILYNKFNLKCKKNFRSNADNLLVDFHSSILTKWLLQFGHKAENKHIPDFLWSKLSIRQKKILFAAYIAGDGNIFTNINRSTFARYSITTISYQLAWQIYDYLHNMLLMPSINTHPAFIDTNGVHHQRLYNVVWLPDRLQQKSNVRLGNNCIFSIIREINIKKDILFVYNLEVDNIHKYVANGILVNNCVWDSVGQKSSNKYQSGGSMPFYHGICPYCHGVGRTPSEQTESIYLMPIWNYKDWVGWKGSAELSRYPNGLVQTMSAITTITKLKQAKELIIDVAIRKYAHHRFIKDGEPTPIGFGADSYIFTMWKAI